jgi:hypothetical protein
VKPGDLVLISADFLEPHEPRLGILLGEKPVVDREGRNHRGFYDVLTPCGVKLVSEEFFERLSWDV